MAAVLFLPSAVDDLQRLAAFLREEDPRAAADTAGLMVALGALEKYPLIGRAIDGDKRELVIHRGRNGYLAQFHYDPVDDEVVVISIRHQRALED